MTRDIRPHVRLLEQDLPDPEPVRDPVVFVELLGYPVTLVATPYERISVEDE